MIAASSAIKRNPGGRHPVALDLAHRFLFGCAMPNRSNLVALPNLLTYARIVAIPVIAWFVISGDPTLRWIGFALYIAAAVTDFLDGYLARRWNQSSPLGRMLDPIADKLLVGALIIVFAWDHTFTAFDLIPAILILLREIFVSGLREFMGTASIVVKVTQLAKWKTTVQLLAIGAAFLIPLLPPVTIVAVALLWLAAVLTVVTGAQYFLGAWPQLAGDAE
jgi:CDP-diacylglycerol--glycerol-3-phosphate 3-phosphatidyltransferase